MGNWLALWQLKALYLNANNVDTTFCQIITDFVHQFPKAMVLDTFLSKYGKIMELLAHYRNVEVFECTDGKHLFFKNIY